MNLQFWSKADRTNLPCCQQIVTLLGFQSRGSEIGPQVSPAVSFQKKVTFFSDAVGHQLDCFKHMQDDKNILSKLACYF